MGVRDDPYLKDFGDTRLQVVFGVANTAACAHHLHVARHSATLVAEVVLMGDGALADVGDDFHVRMQMRREA